MLGTVWVPDCCIGSCHFFHPKLSVFSSLSVPEASRVDSLLHLLALLHESPRLKRPLSLQPLPLPLQAILRCCSSLGSILAIPAPSLHTSITSSLTTTLTNSYKPGTSRCQFQTRVSPLVHVGKLSINEQMCFTLVSLLRMEVCLTNHLRSGSPPWY